MRRLWFFITVLPLVVVAGLFALTLFIAAGPTKASRMLHAMTFGLKALG